MHGQNHIKFSIMYIREFITTDRFGANILLYFFNPR